MRRIFSYKVPALEDGLTIAVFLKSRGFSHHVMIHLKKTPGGLRCNGIPVFTNHIVRTGDLVEAAVIEETGSSQIVPVSLPLSIVYEDEDLMVINKPANLPVHPSMGNYDNTLANAVAFYFSSRDIPYVYRCINRLDRDTSGLLILAKNMVSSGLLSVMSSRREIHREYLALADGLVPQSGTIEAPISRSGDSVIERCVDFEHGETAITHYERLAFCKEASCSAVKIRLETGRTHQIRVHMRYLGHPLLGDFLYFPAYLTRSDCKIRRQALHSRHLSFIHPITGEPLSFTAPLPDDMAAVISDPLLL